MQRYLSEFLGTFILVFTGCGAIAVSSLTGGEPQFVGIGIIWGLIVMSVIFTIGDISGAHINPAVTIAFWVARRFSALDVVPYILAQCLGATAASGMLWYLFGNHAANGVTHLHPQVTEAQGFILEILLTWFLMFAVINVSTGAKEKGITAAIAIGGVISIDVLFGGKVTGASMNPARSLGPALVSGDFDQLWIFIAGPIIGAIVAIGCAAAIRPGVCCPPPAP
jgi:MIP family channel proteins